MLDHTHSGKSIKLFKSMVKSRRSELIESVIRTELRELDKRLISGETAEAAMDAIMKMARAKQKRTQTSKL